MFLSPEVALNGKPLFSRAGNPGGPSLTPPGRGTCSLWASFCLLSFLWDGFAGHTGPLVSLSRGVPGDCSLPPPPRAKSRDAHQP